MKALVIGGTGLIGAGIVKHLLARGATVTSYDRGRRAHSLGPEVTQLLGDRRDAAAFERTFHDSRYDVVVDLACFAPEDADSAVRAFGGRCEHFQFCSTVCTYGVEVPRGVLVDETFVQRPTTSYAKNKVGCEAIFRRAAKDKRFEITILRPSHTYGPGSPLLDQLEVDTIAWDRVERGLPVMCSGDGLGLWQPTHRDDCGKLFAGAALNAKTYGEAYNATGDEIFTWREYYRVAARALGTRAQLVFVPAAWLLAKDRDRFGFLAEITQFHGAYSSSKAKLHVPEFRAAIDFEGGARETFADIRRRGAWRDSTSDRAYQCLVDDALAMGLPIVDA